MAALCDTNVWLSLALDGHQHHTNTCEWLDGIEKPAEVYFCRATQQSLLRLLTTRAVLAAYGNPPLTTSEAWQVYDKFLTDDRIVMAPGEPTGLEATWRNFASTNRPSPKLWMDAYLAAFAATAGLQLVTIDTDFQQFQGVQTRLL